MDWTAQTPPRDSEIINELVSRVTHGFDSPNSPYGLRNQQRTAVTGDARIRQPKPTAKESETINEMLSRVTHGFDGPNSP
jgi:hypothetical protein